MKLTSITSRLIGVDATPSFGDRAPRPAEPLTPLLDIANLHVSGAIRNSEYAEVFWEPFYRFGLKGDPLVPDADGMLKVPTAPGLGVDLDWDWLDDHTLETF